MDFDCLFIWVLFLLVSLLLMCIAKTIFHTKLLKKSINKNYRVLQENLFYENYKLEKNCEKLQLVEDLHKTLFNSLFKITRDTILMQKLIFETYIK